MDRPCLPHGCRPLFGSGPVVRASMFTTLVQRTNKKAAPAALKRRDAAFVQQVIMNIWAARNYIMRTRTPTHRSEGKAERKHQRRVIKRVDRLHSRLLDIGVDITRRNRRRTD